MSVKIDGEWITKSNCAGETDVEGEKGQASTAFKRAAVKFGVGRSLYELKNHWYEVEKKGRTVVFTDGAVKKMKDEYERWIRGIQPRPTDDRPAYSQEEYETFHRLLNEDDPIAFVVFTNSLSVIKRTALHNSFERGKTVVGKKKADAMESAGIDLITKYAEALGEAARDNDEAKANENWEELSDAAKEFIWHNHLNDETRHFLKSARKAA